MDRAWGTGDVVRLMTGEPDFPTPPHSVAAVHAALEAGHTRYVPNAGLLDLRRAVADGYTVERGVPTNVSNTVVTTGAMLGAATALLAMLDAGDEVLIPHPGWPSYAMAVGLFGDRPGPYRTTIENAFLPDPELVERFICDRTKCILLCNP